MAIKEGDIVWTKLRGFPWWPGKVDKIIDKTKEIKYNIKFIGDNSLAFVNKDQIQSFIEGIKNDFSNIKKKSLLKAYEEAKKLYEKVNGKIDFEICQLSNKSKYLYNVIYLSCISCYVYMLYTMLYIILYKRRI